MRNTDAPLTEEEEIASAMVNAPRAATARIEKATARTDMLEGGVGASTSAEASMPNSTALQRAAGFPADQSHLPDGLRSIDNMHSDAAASQDDESCDSCGRTGKHWRCCQREDGPRGHAESLEAYAARIERQKQHQAAANVRRPRIGVFHTEPPAPTRDGHPDGPLPLPLGTTSLIGSASTAAATVLIITGSGTPPPTSSEAKGLQPPPTHRRQ